MQRDTQLGRYRITDKLGEGGMGKVYRAEDPSLKRDVAIKVLPPDVASDPERMARLEREAQVLAALEHPNVAAIYGLEDADGVRFLVMQLASGESLDERLARGPIPADEVIPIAIQIARGLEAAHEAGIVHRDLKPANVMLDEDGGVKLLDFGLAKPNAGTDKSVELTASPTMLEASRAGMIMGTASYMSPEQARGRRVDKRADIWAWGCVVYEMLTGRKLFEGDSVSDIIAAVLRQDISLEELPANTPPPLLRLVARALVRDPADRLRDIGDARIALTHPEEVADHTPVTTRNSSLTAIAAAGIAGLALGALALWLAAPIAEPPPLQLDIAPPGLQTGPLAAPVISPDGTRVLYRADDRLWVRDLTEATGREIPGTDGVEIPFWAPDSDTIAYASDGSIWRQSLGGSGAATRVASFPSLAAGGGGVWDPAGRMLVAMGSTEIYSIPDRGGEAGVLLDPDPARDEGHFHRATVLPGGDLAYIVHRGAGTAETIGVLPTRGERRNLITLPGDYLADLWFWPGGGLLFSRRGPGGNGVWVLPFDADSLEQTGEPVMLIPGAAAPSLSADGLRLLYSPEPRDVLTAGRGRIGHLNENLGRADRQGFLEITPYENLMAERDGQRISPDGRRLAFVIRSESGADVWTLDLTRGTRDRMTDDTAFNSEPAWSPDGEWIYFTRNDTQVARVRADGSADVEVLGEGRRPTVIPGSGRLVVLRRPGTTSVGDELWFLDAGAPGEAEPFRAGRAVFGSVSASSDGRLLAYGSRETNSWEVLVEDLETGQRWQVSDGGGEDPRWGPDGNLYYVAPARMLTRVDVTRTADAAPRFGPPDDIVAISPSFGIRDIQPVMIDGELRFLTSEREPVDTGGGRLVVALNADRMIREALGR